MQLTAMGGTGLPTVDVDKLSPRALKRLRILARMLMQRGYRFHGDAQAAIRQVLHAAKRQRDHEELRSLVDWVEEYDRAEEERQRIAARLAPAYRARRAV